MVDRRADASLPWLTRLRWGLAAGELAAIGILRGFIGMPLSLPRLLGLVALTAATNLVLESRRRRGLPVSRGLCGAALSLDTLVLTGLLHALGGPSNPFSVLYLVQITLAAVVLGAAWTWGLAALAIACYGSLFLFHLTPVASGMHVHGDDFSLHLQGMWVAFVLAAGLTAYFVVKLSAAIDSRDEELAAMRERSARTERLAALTTLAAGAAHELGTPLGTIAVAAKELERALGGIAARDGESLASDAQLIRAEVDRCRRILDQMADEAGETAGEAPASVTIEALIRDATSGFSGELAARIRVEGATAGTAMVPRRAVSRALANLLKNALDASDAAVTLSVDASSERMRLSVRDRGPGMPPDVLARAVEPFYSTKPAGQGLGLGLFLASTVAQRMGGRLTLESGPGGGVTACLDLPLPARAVGTAHA